MCNCIQTIENEVAEKFTEHNGKKVTDVRVDTTYIKKGGGVQRITKTDVFLNLEGQIKKASISMKHGFCPFCGERQIHEQPLETSDGTSEEKKHS